MKSLSEKVIVIMGASSGIGEATARLLARKGAKLVIAARRQERLIAIKKELPEATILVQQADVTKEEEVQRVIKLTMEKYGRIDVLFNNAGVMPTAPLIEAPKGEWRQMLDINIMGVLNGIAAVLPIMVEQKSGQIIATDSVAGHVVYPDSAVYCGTKFAVRAIMEGLRQEQRENNIKSTIISPGAVQTELYQTISNRVVAETLHLEQLSWVLKAEDIAQAVVFAIDTPDRMSISEMVVRPTTQTI
ncbi:SDR family NAD(P)-dependent oxidoreductase [Enterococcus faecalis]|uniref:SDR family oxidoreductase n=1 Tax=Enterococcus faecalis TaxID=1351 RepID=A0A8B3RRR3_ENTFL|nr:SDR family oxidoreductase [Enterococcus faecalis]MDF4035077.1 SDR family oxidoreductase [Staphylococcus aureus]EGO2654391.1 SDR family oxidoreductase [Enterococcus faecalis]EGO2698226.1 SDR family oxidoreductase [Enterococcus faecalis]EGO2743394.1 SDR family oxidoreductase [Enterococcus faecalis]EGO2803368.1 SDR family oxidoreductase [Enterococcus faecalis]